MHRIFFSIIAALGSAIGATLGLKIIYSLSLKLTVFLGVFCFVMAVLLDYYLYPKFFQKQIASHSSQAFKESGEDETTMYNEE